MLIESLREVYLHVQGMAVIFWSMSYTVYMCMYNVCTLLQCGVDREVYLHVYTCTRHGCNLLEHVLHSLHTQSTCVCIVLFI